MLRSNWIALFWGLMEGLWFFIVPDIALSYIAMKGTRAAIIGTLMVILGALLAAALLYMGLFFSPEFSAYLVQLWQNLPGFYPKMLTVAHEHLASDQARGLLAGPTSGIPYRFYVLEAWKLHIPLYELWVWTPAARLERIFLAPLVVLVLNWGLGKIHRRYFKFPARRLQLGLYVAITIYWLGIYIWYWGILLPSLYS